MYPGTHLLVSWVSGATFLKSRRERTIVAWFGVAPDLDGLGFIIDNITGTTAFYLKYHHYVGHSVVSAFVLASFASLIAKSEKKLTWILTFLVVHLHLFCDVIGAKGPDGYQWPIYYLYPFNSEFGIVWKRQWELDAWQNDLTLILLFLCCAYYAITKRITFLEVVSKKLDQEAFKMFNNYLKKILTNLSK